MFSCDPGCCGELRSAPCRMGRRGEVQLPADRFYFSGSPRADAGKKALSSTGWRFRLHAGEVFDVRSFGSLEFHTGLRRPRRGKRSDGQVRHETVACILLLWELREVRSASLSFGCEMRGGPDACQRVINAAPMVTAGVSLWRVKRFVLTCADGDVHRCHCGCATGSGRRR